MIWSNVLCKSFKSSPIFSSDFVPSSQRFLYLLSFEVVLISSAQSYLKHVCLTFSAFYLFFFNLYLNILGVFICLLSNLTHSNYSDIRNFLNQSYESVLCLYTGQFSRETFSIWTFIATLPCCMSQKHILFNERPQTNCLRHRLELEVKWFP